MKKFCFIPAACVYMNIKSKNKKEIPSTLGQDRLLQFRGTHGREQEPVHLKNSNESCHMNDSKYT